jgi:hypothetical protein
MSRGLVNVLPLLDIRAVREFFLRLTQRARDLLLRLRASRDHCEGKVLLSPAGCSKRPFSKAAASEDRKRTLWGTLRI